MNKLDEKISKKILRIIKPYHNQEDYELNYVINDDEIVFFLSINESEEISFEDLAKIASALDGAYLGSGVINQEYRYKFNLNPCGD